MDKTDHTGMDDGEPDLELEVLDRMSQILHHRMMTRKKGAKGDAESAAEDAAPGEEPEMPWYYKDQAPPAKKPEPPKAPVKKKAIHGIPPGLAKHMKG